MSLKNMTKRHIGAYDRNNETFVVHKREVGLPNMEFRMHTLGLHVYHPNEPNKYNITFINKVLDNIKNIHQNGNQRIKYYEATLCQAAVSIQYILQMDDKEQLHQELWRKGKMY